MAVLKLSVMMVVGLVLAFAGVSGSADAHPHVWVTAKAEVVYDQGQIVAIQHHWTFDEFYTAMAIQGLDKNGDGIYSRDELAELAQVNMDGLKEFDYFTYALVGKTAVAFSPPVEPWLEHKDGVLTLHFKLPVTKPIPASTPGFSFAIYDPSFFIAFELAKGQAVTLAGAPLGCSVRVGDEEKTTPPAGAVPDDLAGSVFSGGVTTKSAWVTCAKS